MNIRSIALIVTAGSAILFAPVRAQETQPAQRLLEAARQKETIDGDLKAAIEQYQSIVQRFAKTDRSAAAAALLHMAECHQKLGDQQSRAIYERIVRDFADQKEAALAHGRLGDPAQSSSTVASRQVWTLPPVSDIFGNVSPDGRYIPYIDEMPGDLYLHDLRAGTNRRLTDKTVPGWIGAGTFIQFHAFSRDGSQLAHTWAVKEEDLPTRLQLRVINLQGSGVPAFRTLVDNRDIRYINPYDWSPDGKWIAVSVHRMDLSAQIGLVSTTDGSLRILKSVDWDGPSKMFFSSDGRYLAFDLPAADASKQRDIFVLAVDGAREISAVVHPSNDRLVGWSPDGTRLLFVSDRSDQSNLWAVRFENGAIRGEPELVKRDFTYGEMMGVTSTGVVYTVVYGAREQDVYEASFDFTEGKLTSAPALAVHTSVGANRQPGWSPDGQYLAYLSGDFSIGIQSVASGAVRTLSLKDSLAYLRTFSWGADSGSFLVAGRDTKGRDGIFRVDAQTGRATAIVPKPSDGGQAVMPTESADGKFIYYIMTTAGVLDRYVKRDLSSGRETVLTQGQFAPMFNQVRLSPDARYVATSRTLASQPSAIVIVGTDGGEAREVMHADRPLDVKMWAPDSQSLFVRKDSELWRVFVNGAEPIRLDVKMTPQMGPFRVHPDGRRIAFQNDAEMKPQEIWVLDGLSRAGK